MAEDDASEEDLLVMAPRFDLLAVLALAIKKNICSVRTSGYLGFTLRWYSRIPSMS